MDVALVEECGLVSPQWYVQCDVKERESKDQLFADLKILTSEGVTITDEDQIVDVGPDIDLIKLFFEPQPGSNKDLPKLTGKGYISNYDDFERVDYFSESSVMALTPTLLGTIAEGLALTNVDAHDSSQLKIQFNCKEDSMDNLV